LLFVTGILLKYVTDHYIVAIPLSVPGAVFDPYWTSGPESLAIPHPLIMLEDVYGRMKDACVCFITSWGDWTDRG